MEEKTKILKKLHQIMAAAEAVVKKGWNENQQYTYATEFDVLEVLREKFVEEKLVIIPTTEKCEVLPAGQTKGGASTFLTTVTIRYTIYDSESGESVETVFTGQGLDFGDKGIYKAYTGANKYFLLKTFQIPTEDDPENDRSAKTAKRSLPASASATDNKKDGTIEFRMKSKFGDASKPAKCGFCNNYHVIAGEEIVKVNGKYGKEECLSSYDMSQNVSTDEVPIGQEPQH